MYIDFPFPKISKDSQWKLLWPSQHKDDPAVDDGFKFMPSTLANYVYIGKPTLAIYWEYGKRKQEAMAKKISDEESARDAAESVVLNKGDFGSCTNDLKAALFSGKKDETKDTTTTNPKMSMAFMRKQPVKILGDQEAEQFLKNEYLTDH